MSRARRYACTIRAIGGVLAIAGLAACSSPGQHSASKQDTAKYLAHAKRSYTPPGPAEDPWGPYISKASTRFDMPESWIRAIMRQESGGRMYLNGELITSRAGAMGLMQVMPGTYEELRDRYELGDDPFDPHDNIMAGVAYMREMYDIYGSPGFLAAYNAGPARLDDYLTNTRGLPDETRRYVASIGPNLLGDGPRVRSPAEQYAMNALPLNIPPGTRYGRGAVQLASSSTGGTGRVPARRPVEVAQLATPVRTPAPQQVAVVLPPAAPQPAAPARKGISLISPAVAAESSPLKRGSASGGQWAIQVGAYANQGMAQSAVATARGKAGSELSVGKAQVGSVKQGRNTLWRARVTGLSRETAVQACEKLSRGRNACIVLSPEAQS
ncbi:MAG: transglycosylase SLT domain-containing protein [Acetobacteraceae bacterium]